MIKSTNSHVCIPDGLDFLEPVLPGEAVHLGTSGYVVPDVMSNVYADGHVEWASDDGLGLRFDSQFTHQASIGRALLAGSGPPRCRPQDAARSAPLVPDSRALPRWAGRCHSAVSVGANVLVFGGGADLSNSVSQRGGRLRARRLVNLRAKKRSDVASQSA